MTRMLTALFAILLTVLPATAQQDEAQDTILVLDASGSMWGQIDGVNKIVIARDVIAGVMQDLPPGLDLGLMAYGHNRRGDCADIEMLIEPGPDTREAIVDAVNGINPRGRTPMTDAVVAAAQALRHTENAATVILVSDGIETCDADPCAIAAELEASGVGFTAHVIGFDVASEPEARAQMQCLAENTGGEFLTADTAEELAAALTQVAAAPPPPPPGLVTVTAVVEPDGTPPVSPLTWTLRDNSGAAILGPVAAPGFNVELTAGDYAVEVIRESQGTTHSAAFAVTAGESRQVVIPLPALLTPVTFEARLDSMDGELIAEPVIWSIRPTPETAGEDEEGNPLSFDLMAGAYTVEAYWTAAEQTQTVQVSILGADPRLVTVVFDTPAPSATLVAPTEAVAGSTIEVAWQGPGADGDFITIFPADSQIAATNARIALGNPTPIRVPSAPGAYRITYNQGTGQPALAEQALTVTPATATLVAPETALVGETVEVAWTGPDYDPDFIAILEPGETRLIDYTLTREGSPLGIVMPSEPGTYEIHYSMQQDRYVLARTLIEVSAISATLEAVETAAAGSEVEVVWTGPDYQNDFVAIAPVGEDRYGNYTYTRHGSPLDLTMPTEPGRYEIRYYMNQDRTILASREIEVTGVTATLVAPDSAAAGSDVEVAWSGPDYQNDFIAIAPVGGDRYGNYTYTRHGSPLDLTMPTEPGRYEIRYYANQDRTVLASREIEVTGVAASLVVPETAAAGSDIEVTWTGPDYQNDFIAIAPLGGDRYSNYSYTRHGSPLELTMPAEPGEYEIRYYVNQDRTVLASVPITLTSVAASLVAPDTAVGGSTVEVTWTGPDYDRDFIAVSEVGVDNRYINYVYTRDGSPTELLMPVPPGEYEIRYYVDQDRTVLAVHPITVSSVSASLQAPAEAVAGDTIEVTWQGPDYNRDFIAIAEVGVDNRYLNYTYTRDGSPLDLLMPSQPGSYEIRYYIDQDRTQAAVVPITVTEIPEVIIDAPPTVTAGSQIQLRHTGPAYARDFIGFGLPDDDRRYAGYSYTDGDGPITINVPDEAGTYELRYYMGQDNRILARREITVE